MIYTIFLALAIAFAYHTHKQSREIKRLNTELLFAVAAAKLQRNMRILEKEGMCKL